MSITSNNDIEIGTKSSSNVPSQNEIQKSETCIVCCGGISILSLVLGIIAAVICYYYFGIKYLIDYSEENAECNSHIWDYVLTSLICSFVLGGSQTSTSKKEESSVGQKVCASIIIGAIWVGIATWGLVETIDENCKGIRDTPLWTFAHVIAIIQMVIGCLTFTISCCIGVLASSG